MNDKKLLRNCKIDVIPPAWKKDIDRILTKELLEANRAYAEKNDYISKLINKTALMNPERFYLELRSRWQWHNAFYEDLLEPALQHLVAEDNFSLTPTQTAHLMDVYETMVLVDEATLIMSAAIKKHIKIWTSDTQMPYLSEEEKFMLLTPPVESFWLQYHIDHLEYYLAKKQNKDTTGLVTNLLRKYHANDESIFRGRLTKFDQYEKQSEKAIKEEMERLRISESYKSDHFYFTLERPRFRAVRDTLIYDNLEEYNILVGLVGISGFILRKRILEYLNKTKILPNNTNIYDQKDEKIIKGLQKMKAYREEVSFKNVSHHRQTGLTCGASCLMMVLFYYGKSKLDIATEKRLHDITKSKHMEGNHFSGLAREASKEGLETILIHSEKGMFKNDGMLDSKLFDKLMKEYKTMLSEAIRNKAAVKNGVNINFELIRRYLENDYLVIMAGQMSGVLHAVLAVGYNTEGLIVNDPLKTKRSIMREQHVESFISTPIGRWMMAIRNDKTTLNHLSDELSTYRKQAKNFLDRTNAKGGEKSEKI